MQKWCYEPSKNVYSIDRGAPCLPDGGVPVMENRMTRDQFAKFLRELRDARDNGQDIDAIVKQHEHENVYFYNDGCLKKILASEKNLMLTTDLVNAALNLIGTDRVENPKLVNPFIPGELGYHSAEPDILLTNERAANLPRDRISIEVQHEGYALFRERLVLYIARLTNNMIKAGETPLLDNLNVVCFQFFNVFAESPNYRHTVQLKNQEQIVYFDKQTVTVIEVEKFLKNPAKFAGDNSRLAQWLRAIDTLNREDDFSAFSRDRVFGVLQNECKLYNFSARYLMTDEMKSIDRATAVFYKQEQIAKNLLKSGFEPELVARNTEVPLFMVNEIKEKLALEEA